jgi:hypothetical protein
MTKILYETDYNQWVNETVQQLRERKFDGVDWDNLIEEIEDMGKSQKRALESFLNRLVEHLLKLSYWESEKERNTNHWKSEIVNFRYQVHKRLKESPSLRPELESIYAEIFPVAIKSVSQLFSLEKDAYILTENMTESTGKQFVLNSRKYNESLEDKLVNWVVKNFNNKDKICISGLAFKGIPDTSDLRGSSGINIAQLCFDRHSIQIGTCCSISRGYCCRNLNQRRLFVGIWISDGTFL